MLQLSETRSAGERRQVLRTAIRQLERGDLYLSAVAAMELGDRDARHAIDRLRIDLEGLRRHLVQLRQLT